MCSTNDLVAKGSTEATGQKGALYGFPYKKDVKDACADATTQKCTANQLALERQRAEREAVLDAMRMLS
jgi:hypothetical protein